MKELTGLMIIAIAFFLTIPSCRAQEVREEVRRMSMGNYNALVMELQNISADVAEDSWKEFIREFGGKTRKNRRENEWQTEGAQIIGVGSVEPVDVYATFAESGENSSMAVWIYQKGEFLSSSKDSASYDKASQLLRDFALEARTNMLGELLDTEEKALSRLERDLQKLERDNENYHNDIERYREQIRDAEQDIEENIEEQAATRQKIELQKESVEELRERISQLQRKD